MFPAAFDYVAPSTLSEALSILKERGDDAKVMAGGQSLIPLLKLRFSQPALVVDIGRLPAMSEIKRDDGHVRIGALVRHVDVERSKELAKLVPLMVEAVHWIADPLVRNRGTVVGSVCHADPAGDWGSIMLALNAELVAQSSSGERVIPVDGFFQGPFTTTLRADEVVTAIRIPVPTGHAGGSYHKLERKVGDFATVAVSVQIELDGRKVKSAGIGLTSVGATNLKAKQAEKALVGHELKDDVIAEAARLAAAAAEPKDDIRGTAAYKKDMVRVFVQRGLKAALARAQEVKA
ncbi:MAG TPA: xanthine dehydrogenase family protein subunit M [Candidatus Eisenbacteria bacterium]|nr:xanthine dehydrogenase family protein subunit M [Candidatus Eisenbacteria bacterium]